MMIRRKKLITLLSALLILVTLISINCKKLYNNHSENKSHNKKNYWKKPSGKLSFIKIYLNKETNNIVTINEDDFDIYDSNDNYSRMSTYKCSSEKCKAYNYNISNNHILIEDSSYVIYDYKNNLYKELNIEKENNTFAKLLYYGSKDYGIALKNNTSKYAYYSLKDKKIKTSYMFGDIFTNESSFLDDKIIATTYHDGMIKYNIVNLKNQNIVLEFDNYISSIGNSNAVYYFEKIKNEEKDMYKIYNSKLKILSDKEYYLIGITDKGNLVVSDDNVSFHIYNKDGTLIKKSKPYKRIYTIVNKYIIVKDNDDYLKIIDFDSNVIKKVLKFSDSDTLISASYKKTTTDECIIMTVFNNLKNDRAEYSYSLKELKMSIYNMIDEN